MLRVETRITRNGQITLTRDLRKKTGLEIGDFVIIEFLDEEENTLKLTPARIQPIRKEE